MIVVTTRNFPSSSSAAASFVLVPLQIVLFLMQIQNQSVHCQLDSNINTLRYDGEVNIGKVAFPFYFVFPFFRGTFLKTQYIWFF